MIIILSIVAAIAVAFGYIVYKKYTTALEELASYEDRVDDLNMVISALQNQLHNTAAKNVSVRVKSTAKKTQGKKVATKTVVAPEPVKRGRKKTTS